MIVVTKGSATIQTNKKPDEGPKNYVIWVMGQSNAGNSSNNPEGSYGEPYDSDAPIQEWYTEETWDTFIFRDWTDPYRSSIGPSLGVIWWFNQNMSTEDTLYVCKINKGSSGLFERETNSWNKTSNVVPWANYVSTVPVIEGNLPDEYINLGCLWVQGEEDSQSLTTAAPFATNLDFLIANVEAEYRPMNWVLSKLSLVDFGYNEYINDAYTAKETSNPQKYQALETSDLVSSPSAIIHYNVNSMILLGSRGIAALFNMQ